MGKQVVNRSTKPKSDNNRFGPLGDDDDADENFSGESAVAVSQDESQTSSLTAASPGGVHPFFLPPPGGAKKSPSQASRGASRSAAGQ